MSILPSAPRPQQREPLRIVTDIPLFERYSSDSSSGSSSPINRNVTPGTTPSTDTPQYFFHVLCMHDFESLDPAHLSFHKDEILTIVKQEHSGWWAAMRPQGDRIGWIPSSFVMPLDRSKIVEYPDETLTHWPYESLNDPPLSAVLDPWVPASEDCTALSFRLVTPTDLALYKGFFDLRDQNYEQFFISPNGERSPDGEDAFLSPECLPPYRIQRRKSKSPLPSEPGTSPLYYHLRLRQSHDQISLPRLMAPAESGETTPELISCSDSLAVLKSIAVSQGVSADGRSQCLGLSVDFSPPGPGQDISDVKLLDLTTWGPDNLAEQFCVLTHTLYATIRQSDCLDWLAAHGNTDMTRLRHFFDVHDHTASWVRRSILAHDDITRQTETLDSWIRVAEKCHTLRNFDSQPTIIVELSGPPLSSLESAWARCAHKQTFVTLRDMLDVENESYCLVDTMDAAMGPCVPFVRMHLDHIKQLHAGHPCQSKHVADVSSSTALCGTQVATVSTLLRYQSSPYDFKVAKPIHIIWPGDGIH